jgi:hypothetical protein
MVLVVVVNSESIDAQQESPLCRKNATVNCKSGSSTTCNAECRRWYLNPSTGEWSLSGDPKWLWELRCLVPAAHVYSNATNVPVTAPAEDEDNGKTGVTNLGEQVCITYFACSCTFPNAQEGSTCQVGNVELENKIYKEEVTGDDCVGGQ